MEMDKSCAEDPQTKVFYRPVEAAIRWSGLSRLEPRILALLDEGRLPEHADIPRWPQLCLNRERIRDALINGDLPYGKNGITTNDPDLLHDPGLTVRHVDLKAWMTRHYPGEKPPFLFDKIERNLHPAISIDAVGALLAEREAFRAQLAEHRHLFDALRTEHETLVKAHATCNTEPVPGPRSESTYMNIIGGLLALLLGKSPSGIPYSSFDTTEAVISALTAHFKGRFGMSERTLWSKFTEAKRHFSSLAS